MKKILFLFAFLSIWLVGFAQTTFKVFLNANGEKLKDSVKADSYLVIRQLPKDSGWYVRQFSMGDTILTSGYYKNSELSIPNGRFEYYTLYNGYIHLQYNYAKHKMDTINNRKINFLQYSGNYVNGKKEGVWEEYFRTGGLVNTSTYQNNVLNGIYKTYNLTGGAVLVEGNIINNIREGEWNQLGANGEILRTDIYKKGKIIKTIAHLDYKNSQRITDAKNEYDLVKYLNKALATFRFSKQGKFEVQYGFTLTTTGLLTDPSVHRSSTLEIDTAVLNAFAVAPVWTPAKRDGKSISERLNLMLGFTIDEEGKIEFSYPRQSRDDSDPMALPELGDLDRIRKAN